MHIYPFYNDFSATLSMTLYFKCCISETAALICKRDTPLASLNEITLLQRSSDQQLPAAKLFDV